MKKFLALLVSSFLFLSFTSNTFAEVTADGQTETTDCKDGFDQHRTTSSEATGEVEESGTPEVDGSAASEV